MLTRFQIFSIYENYCSCYDKFAILILIFLFCNTKYMIRKIVPFVIATVVNIFSEHSIKVLHIGNFNPNYSCLGKYRPRRTISCCNTSSNY